MVVVVAVDVAVVTDGEIVLIAVASEGDALRGDLLLVTEDALSVLATTI